MGQGGTVHGADNVARTMRALADDVADLPAAVGPDAGSVIVRAAQGYAPRRTGLLRSSIQSVTSATGTVVTAGVGITYAGVQEYGSKRRHIPAKLFMRRAYETQQRNIIDKYETAVNQAVDQVKGV
jgi:HK97 gp10 family phage protein